jgi:hypothetical protein
MKNLKYIIFGVLISLGVQFGLSGCVAEVDGGGYYGGGPWYHDGPWIDGGRWGGPRGVGYIDVHPPGFRR